jgi:pantothenate synthetase
MIDAGQTATQPIIASMREILQQVPSMEIEYISIVDAETLETIEKIAGHVLAAAAVRLGSTRLIDNILMDARR